MSNKQNIIVGVVAVIAIVFGVGYLKQTTVVNDVQVKVPEQQATFGAVPGDTINSPCFEVNGVRTCSSSLTSNLTGTSTLCAILKPTASSTLVSFTGIPAVSTSTAVLLVLEERPTIYAPILSAATSTSHFVTSYMYPANSTNVFATSSVINADSSVNSTSEFLSPSSVNPYLVLYAKTGGVVGQTMGSESSIFPSGIRCKGVFREI